MSANTKVIVFLEGGDLAALDALAEGLLCSRQDALRFLISERHRAANKFKAAKVKPVSKRGRPPKAKPLIEGGME
jgi:hypothetical protein